MGDPFDGLRGRVEPAILTPGLPEGAFRVLGGLAGIRSVAAGLAPVQQPGVLGGVLEVACGAAELVDLGDRPGQPGTVAGQLRAPGGVELGHLLLYPGQLGCIPGGDSGRLLQQARGGGLPLSGLDLLGGDLGHSCEPLRVRHRHRLGLGGLLGMDGWDVDAVQVDEVAHAFPVGGGEEVGGSPAGVGAGLAEDVLDLPAGQVVVGILGDECGLVGVSAAGGAHIEPGPVGALIDQLDRFVHGEALGSVAGHRIGQLHMLPGRLRVEVHRSGAVEADQPHSPVGVDVADAPAFPVGVPAAVRPGRVDAGGDHVPGTDRL